MRTTIKGDLNILRVNIQRLAPIINSHTMECDKASFKKNAVCKCGHDRIWKHYYSIANAFKRIEKRLTK